MSKKKLDKLTLLEAQYQIAGDMFRMIHDEIGVLKSGAKYWASGVKSASDSIGKTFKRLLRRSE